MRRCRNSWEINVNRVIPDEQMEVLNRQFVEFAEQLCNKGIDIEQFHVNIQESARTTGGVR